MAAKTEAKAMEARMSSLFDQAVLTFGDALKAGVRIQEEVAKWWTDALEQGGPVQEWQKKSRAIVSEAIPAAQKNAEEWLKLVEQNYKRSMDLLKKAFDTNGAGKDVQSRTQDLWEASLQVIRENAQAMAQANMKMMELWASVLQKNVEAMPMPRGMRA